MTCSVLRMLASASFEAIHMARTHGKGAAATLLGTAWTPATSAAGRCMETVRCSLLQHHITCGHDHGVHAYL